MNNPPKHHGAGPQKRGVQCSCIGLRPTLFAMQLIGNASCCCHQSIFSLLVSKSLLTFIVCRKRKDHTPRSLEYCLLSQQWVLFFAILFLIHKAFTLKVLLKCATCEKCQHIVQAVACQGKNVYAEGKIVQSLHNMFHLTNTVSE